MSEEKYCKVCAFTSPQGGCGCEESKAFNKIEKAAEFDLEQWASIEAEAILKNTFRDISAIEIALEHGFNKALELVMEIIESEKVFGEVLNKQRVVERITKLKQEG